jgi:hypothetical protein
MRASEFTQGSYVVLKLFGVSSLNYYGENNSAPIFGRETKGYLVMEEGPYQKP